MPQAVVTVNAVVGSNTNLTINTLVQLDNLNIGGELTYAWSILDQPAGTTDNLSSSVASNPTFTPKKEGSYLIRLLVNQGLPTEQENRVVCAVKQLKTLQRIPASGETTEADAQDGWAAASNAMLQQMDALLSDPGIIVGVNASGGNLTRGTIVRCTAASVIKSTLPGQETVPGFTLSTSATLAEVDELLCIVEGTPAGVATVATLGLMKVRYIGRIAAQAIAGGAVAVGDVIYVNDAGALSSVAGTVRRRVGSAMTAGATADVWFNGMGGADIDLTPIDRAYLVHGAKGALVNAVRTDGTNADPSTTGFRFASGAVGTTPLTAKGFAGQTAALQQWLDSADAVLAAVDAEGRFAAPSAVLTALRVKAFAAQTANIFEVQSSAGTVLSSFDKDGDLVFGAAARQAAWPSFFLTEESATEMRLKSAADNADYISMQRTVGGVYSGVVDSAGVSVFLAAVAGAAQVIANNNPLQLVVNAVAEWQVAAGGVLSSLTTKRIANIALPTTAADAVNTDYLHSTARSKNNVLNSAFDFWQRGDTFAVTHAAGANVWDRAWTADRWYAGSVSDGAADGGVANVTKQNLGSGLSASDLAYRLGYAAAGPGNVTAKVVLVQEIDRRLIPGLRGKVLNVSAWLRNVSFPGGRTVTMKLVTGTNAAETETYTGGYTGSATPASVAVDIQASGTSFVRYSAQSSAIGATVTEMSVVIEITGIGNGGGTTDGDMEVAQVMLTESASTLLPPWQRMEATYSSELEACCSFYEKSYDRNTTPGTLTLLGMTLLVSDTAVGTGLGTISFKVRKYKTPAVTFYRGQTAATADWDYGAGAGTVTMTANYIGHTGFVPTPGTAHTGVVFFGHWDASAEIF